MSYSRFGWDGSDVYIFEHTGGGIECCGCPLGWESPRFADLVLLEEHLAAHEAAGHHVPASVRVGIYTDWKAGVFADWDTTDPMEAQAVHAWALLADPHAGEDVATFLERNMHMLRERP